MAEPFGDLILRNEESDWRPGGASSILTNRERRSPLHSVRRRHDAVAIAVLLGGSMRYRRLRAVAPWLSLLVFLLLPIYLISVAFAIRSGLFDLKDRSITDKEIQAIWTLVASGIATGATLVGLLLTRSHNARLLSRGWP